MNIFDAYDLLKRLTTEWKLKDRINTLEGEVHRQRNQLRDMRWALDALFNENVDYIKVNNLGDPLHNKSMQQALLILERTKDVYK